MIPGDLSGAFPHRQAALPNSYPNALRVMQGGSLYHFYDGLWYDPAERRTHDLPRERRTRYRLSQPDTVDEKKVARMHNQTRWSSTLLISFLSFFFHAPYLIELICGSDKDMMLSHFCVFLYPNTPNFTRHQFLDLSVSLLFFKENKINFNIPNFCPPVYIGLVCFEWLVLPFDFMIFFFLFYCCCFLASSLRLIVVNYDYYFLIFYLFSCYDK